MAKTEVVLGIDIGGTKTKFGLVDRAGHCLMATSLPTNADEPASDFFSRLHAKIGETFTSLAETTEIQGIGLGAPNANYYRGTVENPPNLKWGAVVNIVELVSRYFPLPVVITNDANAAAIGELKFGAARGMRHVIVITLGTGVGSGIIVNGELLYGADGFAGEIGHTIVDPAGRQCGCGKRGCLEMYASAGGICRTVFELLADRRDDSELRAFGFRELTSKIVHDAARRGDTVALAAFDQTARILGMKLADAVAHTSPEAIILFGGFAAAGELIMEPTRRYLEEFMFTAYKGKVKLLPAGLKEEESAVIGAGALIWHELEKRGRLNT